MALQRRARTNTKSTRKRSRGNRKEQYLSWALALPALTLLLIFLIIPFVLAISAWYQVHCPPLSSGYLTTHGSWQTIHCAGLS